MIRFKKEKFLYELLNPKEEKMVSGYCVKCKAKGREMNGVSIKQTARGGYMAQGTCTKCNTKMSAMMSKDNAEKAIKEGAKKAF